MTLLDKMKASAAESNLAMKRANGVGMDTSDGPRFTESERVIARRKIVQSLNDQGVSGIRIAAKLNISRNTVTRDLAIIKARGRS